VIETVIGRRRPVIVNFIDFYNVFGCVLRPALSKILERGLPTNNITIIQKLYEESNSAVRIDENTISRLWATSGAHQGCILSALLFAIKIEWILRTTTGNSAEGITTGRRCTPA